ncbi:odorant receptor 43a-like [Mycetomoellerius zeteki]|uniref:odorant receptor 43a-like n=1 Tax=Mycetomoellerius zeteki TaxID=64791 RepID=UPI00084E6161|nr:PREDICTED: odorant receptor 43a-like [Trachymyrmex zeteki]
MTILNSEVARTEFSALIFNMNVTKHSGYKDFVWAIELNRLGLELVGLWPKTNGAVKNTFVSDLRIGVIFFIVTFLSIIPLLCSLVRVWGDMILIVDNLQVTLPLLVVSLKLIVIRWKRTAIVLLVKMMAEDWMELKIDAERNVMIRRAQTARLIVICGFLLMIFVFIVLIILPAFGLHFRYVTNLTDQERLLPFQAYYFYDTDKSPQFELALVIQAATMFLGATTYTSVDAFLGLLILHISGQLENFKHRLIDLTSCKDFDSALQNNVQTHLRIIRFANNIEDTFTLLMLGLVFYFGIVFCLFGFLFVTVITGNEIGHMSLTRICFLVIGIFTLLAHTFLYCGAGEIIAEQCEAVYSTICNLEWYKLEPRKKKYLILLMIRANEPFRISAGKIFPLTMTTFCSLLKTSAGYISFLLAKREIEL